MRKTICLIIIVSMCVGSVLSHQAHSAALMMYSGFGGSASMSTSMGTLSLVSLISRIATLAAASLAVSANNRTVTIIAPPLPFPNPFSLTRVMDTQFGKTGSVIGFTSDRAIAGDIKVLIYDMFGNQVMHRNYSEEDSLNRETIDDPSSNKFTQLTINKRMLNYDAPSGVYLYVVQADGKRIGKGKMLIVP